MKDIIMIKNSVWGDISFLYVETDKRKELFATIFFNKDGIPINVALGPIIFTEFSKVYSRLISYIKIENIINSKDFTNFEYPKRNIISIPKINIDISLICYKFMCLLYYNVFVIFDVIPESSFVYLFYKIKETTPNSVTIDTKYYNDLNCCLKLTHIKDQLIINGKMSKMVENCVCASFPLLYYKVICMKKKEEVIILVLEQIGPTFTTYYMLEEIFTNDKLFTNISNIDKILFEYVYSLYCINMVLKTYHGDLHLNNITIFKSRNSNYDIIYKVGKNFMFRGCDKTAGILDVSNIIPNLYYFNKTFNASLNTTSFTNIEIIKLCSLADSYNLFNNIKTFLSMKKITNTILFTRLEEIICEIYYMVDNTSKIYNLLNKKQWPNMLLMENFFKNYIIKKGSKNCLVFKL